MLLNHKAVKAKELGVLQQTEGLNKEGERGVPGANQFRRSAGCGLMSTSVDTKHLARYDKI